MSSKRWRAAAQLVETEKQYPLAEALELVKKTATTKFDSTVELHFRLGIDPKKADQAVRGTVELPHGRGKELRVAVFAKGPAAEAAKKAGADIVGDDDLVKEIKTHETINFDIALASPDMMKSLAPIAKILGTKGLMPNPKSETVVADPSKAVASWKSKRISYRSDDTGNIHAIIGRASFTPDQLKENYTAIFEAVKRSKPAEAKGTYIVSVVLTSSMGPSIKIDPNS